MIVTDPKVREQRKAEKRAAFQRLKELAGEGRLVSTPRKGFTKAQRAEVKAAYDGCCAACGINVGLSFDIDHIIPLFRGGPHEPANWRLLCKPCHKDKTIEEAPGNAKIRRIEKRDLEGAKPSRLKSRGFEKPRVKKRWPSRPFPSAKPRPA